MAQHKKILVFIGSLTSGGAERVAVSLSKYLSVSEKFEVVFVTLDGYRSDFYTLHHSVKRIAMDMSGATAGIGKFLTNLRRMVAFRKIVRAEKPDIVLGMITRHAVISILACILLPVMVVVSERNYPGKRKNHSMWEILRKYTYRYANAHVVQTSKITEWLRENTNSTNIHIIPNSISWPLENFEPILAPSDFIKQDEKLILAVGSFKEQKGFDLLLDAIPDVLNKHPEWKLVILGGRVDEDEKNSGDLVREQLMSLIAEKHLENRVLLPGKAGNMTEWYQRADIFVLSSRFEGFPNVLLEAMASGTACVSFNCDTGPADLIQHGINGMLVEELNTKELGMTVYEVMNQPGLRKKLADNAIKVRNTFSEEKIMKLWIEIFRELN